MTIGGIDLGVTGFLSVHTEAGDLVALEALPVANGRILVSSLVGLLVDTGVTDIVCEDVHAMPTGSKANFSMGLHLGTVLGIAGTLNRAVHLLKPAEWKRPMGVTKSGKEGKAQAREIASRVYPDWADNFTRVKDHDAAEAVLIGRAYTLRIVRTT